MVEEIIIKVSKGSEGGLHYDIYLDPENVELPEDSEDGGICTAGMHTKECDENDNKDDNDDDCEGCEEAMEKEHTASDWANALSMAAEQAEELLKRKE